MITLLDKFTSKYGFKANYLFNNGAVKDEIQRKCLLVITYMLYDVYEVNRVRVAEIIKRSEATVCRYTNEVQDDFDFNNSKIFGKMFDELLTILEEGESKGIKIE